MKRVTLRLGPAQVFYIERLLADGLAGETFEKVTMNLFLAGLREHVPASWMQEWLARLKESERAKRRRRRRGR